MLEIAVLTNEITNLTFTESLKIIKPLALFILGVVVYSIFIFKFYRSIAKRDIFDLDLDQYNTSSSPILRKFFASVIYIFQYLLIFPVCVTLGSITLASLLAFLSKTQSLQDILLVAVSLVSAVRVTAYYDEDLSKDLAKMLPFALLGVFLVDVSFFSFDKSLNLLLQLPILTKLILYYLIFAICLEFILRITFVIFSGNVKK